jgi:serine/threonine protein kinase
MLKLGLASQLGGSSVPASPGSSGPPPLMPFSFGSYRIVRLLGKGGMGAVYEAEDLAHGRRVALKALAHSLDSPDARKRFLREGRLAASINHQNTVYVFGTEEIEGAPVITMEMVHGGTLHERVKADGPLPVAEAVDAILQIIAGLEAAHAVGILHRDIKPSNCFIDVSGVIKVGDFGLSISTTSRGDSALTIAGSLLGTPEFSSPEQLRGEELSVRSDIYSVGMTLYYLLTGRAAFRAENVVQLLATVLDKSAPSPRSVRADIPEELSRIVLRCLAKQAGDRFANYDELRRALLPFDSTAPTPATLGLRFIAGCIDHFILSALNLVPIFSIDLASALQGNAALQPGLIRVSLGLLLFRISYFAIPEGLWGASIGKAMFGLRVAGLDRSAPGIPRALLRAVIFALPVLPGFLPLLAGATHGQLGAQGVVAGLAFYLLTALLFCTARRRNGFAAVQDLSSKTRVIQKSAYQSRPTVTQAEEAAVGADALPELGPYHLLGTLSSGESSELVLGYDTKLLRRVWIRKVSVDEPPVPLPLRNTTRPGRLRWLQGQRTEANSWDAYEAVPGAPLLNLLRQPQPWKSVRYWLLDLAEELDASSRDGSQPATLALDRVWINADGRAKLLDFPAPGAAANQPIESISTDESRATQVFLNQLAISALEGRIASAEEARNRAAAVPVPLTARDLLRDLRLTPDLTSLSTRLKSLARQVPVVSRRRRLALIACCVAPTLMVGGLIFVGAMINKRWEHGYTDVRPLLASLKLREQLAQGKIPEGLDLETAQQDLDIFIAGRFGKTVREPAVWLSPYTTAIIKPDQREMAEKIVAAHPNPSATDMEKASAIFASRLDEHGKTEANQRREKEDKIWRTTILFTFAGWLLCVALLSLFCSLAFRGGLLMRFLGIAVVTPNGADVSRLRMLWRAFVAWSPLLTGCVLFACLAPLPGSLASTWIVISAVLAVVIWSSTLPERSLQDRIAGTWLVPR